MVYCPFHSLKEWKPRPILHKALCVYVLLMFLNQTYHIIYLLLFFLYCRYQWCLLYIIRLICIIKFLCYCVNCRYQWCPLYNDQCKHSNHLLSDIMYSTGLSTSFNSKFGLTFYATLYNCYLHALPSVRDIQRTLSKVITLDFDVRKKLKV